MRIMHFNISFRNTSKIINFSQMILVLIIFCCFFNNTIYEHLVLQVNTDFLPSYTNRNESNPLQRNRKEFVFSSVCFWHCSHLKRLKKLIFSRRISWSVIVSNAYCIIGCEVASILAYHFILYCMQLQQHHSYLFFSFFLRSTSAKQIPIEISVFSI